MDLMMEKIRKLFRAGPTGPMLSAEDLQEFNLRRATFNNVKCQALMVEESYILWSKNLRQKYSLPVKFEIDPVTGAVTGKE